MDQSRHLAFDAVFTLVYIASSAALAICAASLVLFHMMDVAFTATHWLVAGITIIGALVLPMTPKFYRHFTGIPYDFRGGPAQHSSDL